MKVDDLFLGIENYKCFGSEAQGFDEIRPINLIIGRNNSGKSALIDAVDFASTPKQIELLENERTLWHAGKKPRVVMESPLLQQVVTKVFPGGRRGGEIHGDHAVYGEKWIGRKIRWTLDAKGKQFFISSGDETIKKSDAVAANMPNQFKGKNFRRLFADRDIIPEEDSPSPDVQGNGAGATNVVQHFINKRALPSSKVEAELLQELNRIFSPDAFFSDIVVQQLEDGKWEIELEEETKGKRIAISQSGSGLKTILLVLIYLCLIPALEKRGLGSYIFCFEELENNLHPALQRRLFQYLRDIAVEKNVYMFITTHSNVVIDLFSTDDEAQIIHVAHDGQQATARQVTTYIDNCGVLDDLDIRASDLLQANGIIWVEGPSDRLYVNRWIELWSNGELREGAHYQCIFYGGRLLAHLNSDAPDAEVDQAVQMLRVNRNVAILIDSDFRPGKITLNKTKQRIVSEVEGIGDMAWVTKGKEVENYLPKETIQKLYPDLNVKTPPSPFGHFDRYLDKRKAGEGNRFLRNKVSFAEKARQHISLDGLKATLDLAEKLDELCEHIRRWNRMPEPPSVN